MTVHTENISITAESSIRQLLSKAMIAMLSLTAKLLFLGFWDRSGV